MESDTSQNRSGWVRRFCLSRFCRLQKTAGRRSAFAVLSEGLQKLALDDTLGGIEPEHFGSNFALQRQWLNHWAVQLEVLVPYVPPRIEESNRLTGTVQGRNIGPFGPIAEDTGVGKIANAGGTAVLPADDVINLMRKADAILMYQTVFTPPASAFDDKATRDLIYLMSHWRGSDGRAPSLPEGYALGP